MTEFEKFKKNLTLAINKLLLDQPTLAIQHINPRQGVYRRTIEVILPSISTAAYKNYRFFFQAALPGDERRQTDEEHNHYACFYNIHLLPPGCDEYDGGLFVATIQRKPRKTLVIKTKLYEPIEIYLINTLINIAMQVAPDLKVKHEYI